MNTGLIYEKNAQIKSLKCTVTNLRQIIESEKDKNRTLNKIIDKQNDEIRLLKVAMEKRIF